MYSFILPWKLGDPLNIFGKTPKILVTEVASGKGDWEAKGGVGGGSSLLLHILSYCSFILYYVFVSPLKKEQGL